MTKIFRKLGTFFNTIQGKIAFYPTLFALFGFNFAFLMAWIEDTGISKKILEVTPQLMLQDGDTALTIFSVCIGGLISMMVFSFSMVMLLLSQASSNFSPRILPGLVSDKKNQIILGTYLATILYLIFTLFSIEPDAKTYMLPGLSIMIGIALTILCLAAFIYFIHNMSQSIQISNILDAIYDKSRERLLDTIETESNKKKVVKFPDTKNWKRYSIDKSGYFQNISYRNIHEICEANDLKIHILKPKGSFVLKHESFIAAEKEIDENTLQNIYSNINFSRGEIVEDNYVLAFKQLTEIAIKAMSPGINDPGTAINAIDYLTELFGLRMHKLDTGTIIIDEVQHIKIEVVSFKNLLKYVMATLRTYASHDPIIVEKLLGMLSYLKNEKHICSLEYKAVVDVEIKTLLQDAKSSINSKTDRKRIKKIVKALA